MPPAPGQIRHGYKLASKPGAGVNPTLSSAPLITRVSNIFAVDEPIQRGTHQAPVDIYTLAHATSGALFGFGRAPWWSILAVAVGWSGLGYIAQKLWPTAVAATSMQNLISDSAALILGWAAAKTWVEGRLVGQQQEETVTPEATVP